MEDPTPAENQEGLKLIRQHTVTPIAIGEIFNSIHDCRELIQDQLIDYIRTTVVHAGGITQLRRIAALAELFQVRTGCHGATDLSPVCMGARSEEHTSELQSLMRISYAVFCLKKKTLTKSIIHIYDKTKPKNSIS